MKKLYLAGILFLTPCLWGEDLVETPDSLVADDDSDNHGWRRHRRHHDDDDNEDRWDREDHERRHEERHEEHHEDGEGHHH